MVLGQLVAYAGIKEGRFAAWLPSYGPEMRGGTANCSICLSDEPIGSPLVTNPNVLIAMNRPDQLRSHLGLARQNGLTREELAEAITHLAFYSGWPNSVTAATIAKEVLAPQ